MLPGPWQDCVEGRAGGEGPQRPKGGTTDARGFFQHTVQRTSRSTFHAALDSNRMPRDGLWRMDGGGNQSQYTRQDDAESCCAAWTPRDGLGGGDAPPTPAASEPCQRLAHFLDPRLPPLLLFSNVLCQSLIYGEVEFFSFARVLRKIQPAAGFQPWTCPTS